MSDAVNGRLSGVEPMSQPVPCHGEVLRVVESDGTVLLVWLSRGRRQRRGLVAGLAS